MRGEEANDTHMNELEYLKYQRDELNRRIASLEEKPSFHKNHIVLTDGPKEIWFDGGTSCNIPSKGLGEGYGSYKVADAPIVRVKFGKGHSCNSAEVRTLLAALDAAYERFGHTYLLVRGDSQIALKWARWSGKRQQDPKPPKSNSTPQFLQAVILLLTSIKRFTKVETQWHPRIESVKLFGH